MMLFCQGLYISLIYFWYLLLSKLHQVFFRVKCHFSPYGLGHFTSLVQMFHFSPMGPKKFHRCHFSLLG
ncbi:hypothetical protein Hanom_Chr07g00664551 [Helianthus anomalus]